MDTRPAPPKWHKGGVRRAEWIDQRIAFLTDRITKDQQELERLKQTDKKEG